MTPIMAEEHEILPESNRDVAALLRWCRTLRFSGRLAVYRHKAFGAHVLVELVNRSSMREFHILKHWPSVTQGDKEDITRKLAPTRLTANEDVRLIKQVERDKMARKVLNGQRQREFWRKCEAVKNDHNKGSAFGKVPKLSND